MTEAAALGIDPGLLERFRQAGAKVAWTDVRRKGWTGHRRGAAGYDGPQVRTARLADESARVETEARGSSFRVLTDSGPVGALAVLLECAERGVPDRLQPILAGERSEFPNGAIEAEWGGAKARGRALSLADLVGLARYALP